MIDTDPEALARMREIALAAKPSDAESMATFSAWFGAPTVFALIASLEKSRARVTNLETALKPFRQQARHILEFQPHLTDASAVSIKYGDVTEGNTTLVGDWRKLLAALGDPQ